MSSIDTDIIIVGAGISGLSCARHLNSAGMKCLILESGHRVGGRIISDHVDGFILDRGFQVLQTAYPEVRRQLNLDELDLQPFGPGVAVRLDGRMVLISDPVRNPSNIWSTLTAPIGTFSDRLKMLRLFAENRFKGSNRIFETPDMSTIDFLREYHFSEQIIERFFRPFFAGACLDPDINASSRVFRYLFNVFASGDAALPSKGMGDIPARLAHDIPPDQIHLNTRVESIDEHSVTLSSGQRINARAIVIATQGPETERLLNIRSHSSSRGEHCLYFSSETPPINKPFLILNGEARGIVNNVAVPTLNAPSYSSSGRHLIAVVVLGQLSMDPPSLEKQVRKELTGWFGEHVKGWAHVQTYHIPHALPDQSPPISSPMKGFNKIRDGLYTCGEYKSVPGIQWALLSGRRCAEQVEKDHQKF
ncbi:MAG: FAD-dependent oxidoreductase [Desulfobacteraceae bacterium]|nr:MAG: FAD-dependent oxidoreductase [Desulfobacteraceae bacterium]